ncbi:MULTISPECIES: glutathione S-transferase C-terminal domain-containing protein [Legionella]|uniref:Glutathione S-transferase n=1 Tax=Legionella quinlivanii TaxID=45073 RepID=A0A364LHS8_9GAMM|nr:MULTISPECIES: glutathione S-transferase C-terminal domain-containing protein [Legionella]MCE3044395.1 glutathione S-transferase N-terminal domain-containing protein [Legionella sp. 16cNR16C]RAP35912.1 glutathione S-transferase [Legionella quinlivanii]
MYTLYSARTPNGIKPTIMLEELEVPYSVKMIDIMSGEQFKPEFLIISPNNKIPVIYDSEQDFFLFESVAILQYLAEKNERFLPTHLKAKFQVMQWCYFQAAHIGPMFGQYGHFHRYAPEQVLYAQERYANEVLRLMGVMEKQLASNPFISGNEYTIADMAIWPWLYCYEEFYQAHIDETQFPALIRWYRQIAERPAVMRALDSYE